MKRLLHTPLALLLRRIVLLYAVLMLCRAVFYLYNTQLLGTIGRGELWQLLAGALKFDTASVLVLRRSERRAGRGCQHVRLRLFPVHAETVHRR